MAQDSGKIFVGALSWATTDEKMKQYFSKYGEVIESTVMVDKHTGHSRGFGFVRFNNASSVSEVLKTPLHILDDKQVDPKPCTPVEVQKQKKEAEFQHVQTHKIFIGGLAKTMEEEEVRQYFEKFGPVAEVVFVISKDDHKNKGFGFVTFEKSTSVDKALDVHFHQISGRRIEAKRAQPREKMRPSNNYQQQKQSTGDNNNGYQNSNWSGMAGPDMYSGNMGGYSGHVPSSGYAPNSGYGGYGSYASYPSYGYGSYGGSMDGSYQHMGSYGQQSNASYNPAYSNRSSGGDSRSYHPYKR